MNTAAIVESLLRQNFMSVRRICPSTASVKLSTRADEVDGPDEEDG
jgi:hypothetical protein